MIGEIVEAVQGLSPAPKGGVLGTAKSIDRAGFSQPPEGENAEVMRGLAGVEQALTSDLRVHEARFEVNGAHPLEMRAAGGMEQEIEWGAGSGEVETDDRILRLVFGLEAGEVGGGEIAEGVFGEGFGVESVTKAVAGRAAFAGVGDGSAGFGAVQPRGGALFFSSHKFRRTTHETYVQAASLCACKMAPGINGAGKCCVLWEMNILK